MKSRDSVCDYQKSYGFNMKESYNSPKMITPKTLVETRNLFNYQASILSDNRIVLYKKGKQLGQGYYIIEISSNSESLFITAYNVECSQTIVLQLDG